MASKEDQKDTTQKTKDRAKRTTSKQEELSVVQKGHADLATRRVTNEGIYKGNRHF